MIYQHPLFKTIVVILLFTVPAGIIFDLGTMDIAIIAGVTAAFAVDIFDLTVQLLLRIANFFRRTN